MIISGKDCGTGVRGPSSWPTLHLGPPNHTVSFIQQEGWPRTQMRETRAASVGRDHHLPSAARPTLRLAAGPELRGDAGVVEGGG